MATIQKILVIRFRRIGDAVLSSVICSSLKRTFPNAEIHYVLNKGIAPLFELHPDIDKLITFTEEEMKPLPVYLKKVKQIMAEGKYELIVDTRATIKTLWFSLFSLSTPYRIGKRKFYNLLHNYRPDIEGITDEVTKALHLIKPLEKYFKIQEERNFRLYVTEEEKESFALKMKTKGINLNKPVILCTVSARTNKNNRNRIWDINKMQKVIQHMIEEYDAQFIFNYADIFEKEVSYKIFENLDKPHNIFIDIEAKGLRELAALCANSSFFFGNEGGPRHISQAFNVPSFAIFPPGTPVESWLPNASNRFQGIQPSDLSGYKEDMTYEEKFDLITVAKVWDRLNKMLNEYL